MHKNIIYLCLIFLISFSFSQIVYVDENVNIILDSNMDSIDNYVSDFIYEVDAYIFEQSLDYSDSNSMFVKFYSGSLGGITVTQYVFDTNDVNKNYYMNLDVAMPKDSNIYFIVKGGLLEDVYYDFVDMNWGEFSSNSLKQCQNNTTDYNWITCFADINTFDETFPFENNLLFGFAVLDGDYNKNINYVLDSEFDEYFTYWSVANIVGSGSYDYSIYKKEKLKWLKVKNLEFPFFLEDIPQ